MVSYPYSPKTPVPETQYEEYNGARFAYMKWPVSEEFESCKGRVFIVHGFGEYTKIYYRLMDMLAQHGYESFVFDQRGSGETSPGKLKGLTDEYHTFDDLDHFLAKSSQECQLADIPQFLWGHSMGGGIALNYACRGKHRAQIAGFVASGPLIILHPHSQPKKIVQWVAPLLGNCLPRFRIDTGLDLQGITSDPLYRQFLQEDPMSVPLYGSFRQIHDFLTRGKDLNDNKNNVISKINKPIFIQHGADDTINDPKASQDFIKNCTYADKDLKLYPHARHSILSLETDEIFNQIFQDLVKWLDDHV